MSASEVPVPRKRLRREAFTLIELLVVVAILAILAALLFPVFAQVRERGRATVCASNMHQIGIAFQLYATDEGGSIQDLILGETLPYDENSGMSGGFPYVFLWPNEIRRYVKSDETFICPSNLWTAAISDWWALGSTRALKGKIGYAILLCPGSVVGYGKNISEGVIGGWSPMGIVITSYALALPADIVPISGYPSALGDAILRNPAGTIMLAETRTALCLYPYVTPGFAAEGSLLSLQDADHPDDPSMSIPPIPANGGLIMAHQGRSNWLFYDGHVKSLTVAQTLKAPNIWTGRAEDQPAYDALAANLAPEYR
jgi:prepilin-type N-terminal cleavage/methylation domain-containing protein/prepilin-type processing-associated H-X9-DG protein